MTGVKGVPRPSPELAFRVLVEVLGLESPPNTVEELRCCDEAAFVVVTKFPSVLLW